MFERRHVHGEGGAGVLPERPAAGKRAAQHPLVERFGADRAAVLHPRGLGHDAGILRRGSRGDAVDHRRDGRN